MGIVEEHPAFRSGLAQTVRGAPGLSLAFAVRSVEEFEAAGARVDVVVLGLHPVGLSAAEAVRWMSALGVPVLLAVEEVDQRAVAEALDAGARGCLSDTAEPEEMESAIEAILKGSSYVSSDIASEVLGTMEPDPLLQVVLTDREREILTLVAAGAANKDIAGRLGIGEPTVRSHLDRIRAKTGRSRRQLARLARELGIPPAPLDPSR